MKIKHILTLSLIILAMTSWGQTWNQQFLFRNIKFGNTVDGVLQFNGLATFINGINVPLRSLSDSTDNAASTKFVKQLVQGLGSPLTFGNGLTKTSNSVGLGGDYSNPIVIGDLSENKPSLIMLSSLDQGLKIANFGINNFQNGFGSYLRHSWVSGNPNDYIVSLGSSNIDNNYRNIDISNSSIVRGIKITDFITNAGAFYTSDYSKNWTSEDSTALAPKAYVDRSISGAVSGNYIATNNGTGNNTSLNTPTITNGSANNMTVGLTSPTSGRFTALTATTTATVPTVATSDNSTNAASTAHVKANLVNYAKLNGGNIFTNGNQNIIEDGDSAPLTITSATGRKSNYESDKITFINENGAVLRLARSTASTINRNLIFPDKDGEFAVTSDFATGQTIGANTTGSSASALTWGGSQADFGSAGSNLSTIVGRNTSGVAKPYSFADVKAALATSFQDVTSINPVATNAITIPKLTVIETASTGNALELNNRNITKKYYINIDAMSIDDGIFEIYDATSSASRFNILPDGKLKINNLSGTGSAPVVADANGVLSRGVDNTVSVSSVSGTSQSMSANRVYIPHSTSLTTFTLPTTATEGQLFQIVGEGSGGWRVSQNASQQIVGVNVATTSGTTGYVQSTNANCTITIRCTVANSKFTITSSQGTLTIN